MELYVVVPYTTNASSYTSRVGHRAFVTLDACIKDLEEILTQHERGYATKWGPRGSSSARHNQKTIFKYEVSSSSRLEKIEWLRIDPVNQYEPLLLRDLRGWKRLTQEDYNAWRINALMTGKTYRWNFEDRWLPLFPTSDPPPKRAIMMESFRRR